MFTRGIARSTYRRMTSHDYRRVVSPSTPGLVSRHGCISAQGHTYNTSQYNPEVNAAPPTIQDHQYPARNSVSSGLVLRVDSLPSSLDLRLPNMDRLPADYQDKREANWAPTYRPECPIILLKLVTKYQLHLPSVHW
jgi:hypothetical protein